MLDSFALLSAMRGIRDEYVTDTANALGYSAESPKTHRLLLLSFPFLQESPMR